MAKSFEDLMAALPQRLEPEFAMASPDEPLRLATGRFDLLRDGQLLGRLEGEITLDWVPKLRIIGVGESDLSLADACDARPLQLHAPQLGLTAKADVIKITWGHPHEIQVLLTGTENSGLQNTQKLRFYLVNFPFLQGESVRTGTGQFAEFSHDRLRMTAGPLICTIDRIDQTRNLDRRKPGYLLTHVAEVQAQGHLITPSEVQDIIAALYWLFAFMRGARTGPVLPSVDSPFAKHWISVAPWTVDDARQVDSWLPDRSPVNVNALFGGFIDKWSNPVWNEALRTTIAWYIAANASSTPNEARITLCQIALEVLASLQGFEGGKAYKRIRSLLQGLNIPVQIPSRLQALYDYSSRLKVDAPECLTRIRNKFEHPTGKNRQHTGDIDGITRMQAAQYGLELFELCLLAMMNYRGKYASRALWGWKEGDEVPVPWA